MRSSQLGLRRSVWLPLVTAVLLLAGMVILVPPAHADSVWSTGETPAVPADSDTGAVELGMKFRSSVPTTVTGVRFYKGPGNTGVHKGSLWSRSGTRLATVTFSGETASGWQTASFATPVAISANITYVVSYHAPNGHYSVDENYFGSARTNGTITALASGTDGGNGVYRYGASAFPNSTYQASNYWVDVVTGPADTSAPAVSVTSPADGATVSGGAVALAADATDDVAVASVQFTLDGTNLGAADTTAPYGIAWDSTTVANGAHVLAAVATDTSGNRTASAGTHVTVSNTAPPTAPGIWPDTATPATPAEDDTAGVELGVKFRSAVATTVTGVRFYKGAGNTGTHTGSLWSGTGTRLATATFTGESASGWQAAAFGTPVALQPNTTYVVSYYAPGGRYAVTEGYFAAAHTNGNLTALADGTDGGNGVYSYAGASTFPVSTYRASNYWVDITTAQGDTTAPTVTGTSPGRDATAVATGTAITATFSEAMTPATISAGTVTVRNAAGGQVPATVGYDDTTHRMTAVPTAALEDGVTYTVTLSTGIQDAAGNALAAAYTWSFTTAAAATGPVSPLAQGHGGPILLVTKAGQAFTEYYSEILRAEGLNSFDTVEVGALTSGVLAQHDVVVLGDMALSDGQVTTLTNWVAAGGQLIAMRPDHKLAGLLGLADASGTLADAYLKIDTSRSPGLGITDATIQFHGAADRYTALSGTTAVATLYSTDTQSTAYPAVTMRAVGTGGGTAVAFTYDLARSIVYTHQGNPAWAGQDRDGNGVIRPNDLFYGAATGDVRPDYVDLNKVAIPQADEQQRLLGNIILELSRKSRPLPRLSYLPYDDKAVVVLAADDHATANGATELDYMLAQSPAGCSVADWDCVRSTTLMYSSTPMTDAQVGSYAAQGFDFGVHTSTDCGNWTADSLAAALDSQLADFRSIFTSVPAQRVNRLHCIAWSDYATMAKDEAARGLRLDLNYYYWPGSWIQDRPGLMTGSGLTMRFADTDGSMIDTYQLPSHLVNESGQTWPQNIDLMLDRALGPEGYYAILGTHYDYSDSFDRQLIQSAKTHGVRLVSGDQILDWTDGRNASYFTPGAWDGDSYTFGATVDGRLRGMGRVLLPVNGSDGVLQSIEKDGAPVTFTTETMKGVSYAVFTASTGSYRVTYGADTVPPTVSSVTPANGATGVSVAGTVEVRFSEPLDPATAIPANVQLSAGQTAVPMTVTYVPQTNSVRIAPTGALAPFTAYDVRIGTGLTDAAGVGLAAAFSSTFTTGDSTVSLWAPAEQTVSAGSDGSTLELGLKFQASRDGEITEIQFYKNPADTATTHTVTLWSATGAALGTAITSGESAGGWQTATFAAPIPVTAGTTYVASYLSPGGYYSYTPGGLAGSFTNGPLTALAAGGVFAVGGGFPAQSYNNLNYWVDVRFQ